MNYAHHYHAITRWNCYYIPPNVIPKRKTIFPVKTISFLSQIINEMCFFAVVVVDKNHFFTILILTVLIAVYNSISFRCDRIGFQYFDGGAHALRRIIFSLIDWEHLGIGSATIFPFLSLRPILFFCPRLEFKRITLRVPNPQLPPPTISRDVTFVRRQCGPWGSGSRRFLRNRKKLSAAENAIYILKHFQFLIHHRRRSMSRLRRDRIKLRQRQHKTYPIHLDHFQIFKTFLIIF